MLTEVLSSSLSCLVTLSALARRVVEHVFLSIECRYIHGNWHCDGSGKTRYHRHRGSG